MLRWVGFLRGHGMRYGRYEQVFRTEMDELSELSWREMGVVKVLLR